MKNRPASSTRSPRSKRAQKSSWCNQAITLIDLYSKRLLIRQLDSIRVLPFPFVLLGKSLFEPVRLSLSGCLVCECGIMKDDELLTAPVTPKSAHFFEIWCPLSSLTLLDRYCVHRLTFYLAAYPLFSPLGPPFPARTSLRSKRPCSPI
jgi:hypothetical protein